MIKFKIEVSTSVALLQEAMSSIGYGEMYGVEVPETSGKTIIEASANLRDLNWIIEQGQRKFDVITVHQGKPVYFETDQIVGGFRCRKKVKLPTVQTED